MSKKVYFKCRLSGAVACFEHEWDIEDMRKHPQYEEVKNAPEPIKQKAKVVKKSKAEE